jgi:hypothetical protein
MVPAEGRWMRTTSEVDGWVDDWTAYLSKYVFAYIVL